MIKKVTSILILIFILSSSFIMAESNLQSVVSAPTMVGTKDDSLIYPYGMAYSKSLDALIFTDTQNHRINILNLKSLTIESLVGVNQGLDRFGFPGGGYEDGDIKKAMFNRPKGVAVADNGAIFIVDTGNNAIRQIYQGKVTTVAGGKASGYKDGKGIEAKFLSPSGIAIDKDGNIFISDTLNDVIRKIDPTGNVTTFAGKKDDKSLLNEPVGLAFDKNGNLFVADGSNHQIKKISAKDKIEILGGNHSIKDKESGYWLGGYMDGPKEISYFNFPKGITLKDDGTIFVADSYNHTIRRISDTDVATLVGAGISGSKLDDDHIIYLDGPMGVLYAKETLFIGDYWNNRIVMIPDNGKYLDPILIDVKDREIMVYLDGNPISFPDVQPLILDGTLKFPIRTVVEALGGQVLWHQEDQKITLIKDKDKVELYLKLGDFFLYKGRSMVGLDLLEKNLTLDAKWLEKNNILWIQHKLQNN